MPELVGSDREQTPARLGGVEPGGGRRQALAHLRERERVPGRGGRYSIRVCENNRRARRAVALHQASDEPAERMVSTGISEPRTTRSATLPNNRRDSPVRPWVAITMRSRPLAACMIST